MLLKALGIMRAFENSEKACTLGSVSNLDLRGSIPGIDLDLPNPYPGTMNAGKPGPKPFKNAFVTKSKF